VVALSKGADDSTLAPTFEPDRCPLFGLREENGNGGVRMAMTGDVGWRLTGDEAGWISAA